MPRPLLLLRRKPSGRRPCRLPEEPAAATTCCRALLAAAPRQRPTVRTPSLSHPFRCSGCHSPRCRRWWPSGYARPPSRVGGEPTRPSATHHYRGLGLQWTKSFDPLMCGARPLWTWSAPLPLLRQQMPFPL